MNGAVDGPILFGNNPFYAYNPNNMKSLIKRHKKSRYVSTRIAFIRRSSVADAVDTMYMKIGKEKMGQ